MDRADRLEGALESVFDQTYGEIEAVVVDGGSTDRTPDVVAEFQDAYPGRVTYVRNEEPRGPSAARNSGVKATEARYVAFLDDDDRWVEEKTRKQIESLESAESDTGVIYGGFRSVTEDSEYVHTKIPETDSDLYITLLVEDVVGPPSTVMVRRGAFIQVGGFDEKIGQREDWELYIRLAEQFEFVCLDEVVTIRVVHDNEISKNVEEQRECSERILTRYADELREHGLEPDSWATHHREMGIMYCLEGDVKKGRKQFVQSLQKQFQPLSAVLLLITFLGTRGFTTTLKGKRMLNRHLNNNS